MSTHGDLQYTREICTFWFLVWTIRPSSFLAQSGSFMIYFNSFLECPRRGVNDVFRYKPLLFDRWFSTRGGPGSSDRLAAAH